MKRAFTLIELLVVIAIIGILSSVVLTSLNSARARAKDSAIKSGVLQLRTVMNLEYSDSATYSAIKTGGPWKGDNTNCAAATFTGAYANNARQICNSIMNNYTGAVCGVNCLYFQLTSPDATNQFTIMAYLPGASAQAGSSQYYCVGSSGATSIGVSNPPAGTWENPGCYANP